MEVIVNHLGEVQFEVKARNHTVYCDQPVDAGGFDEGMTPPEFFLASLGACAGYYVAQYAKANGLTAKGMRVRVTAEKAKAPVRLDDIRIVVEYPEPLDPRHREGFENAVHKCLIHNTLLHPPKMTTEIVATEALARAA